MLLMGTIMCPALATQGTSVIAIDGDDGTQLSKTEIAQFVL